MKEVQKAQEIFERERQAYWAMREALMQTHWGKWIAIANGQVVAVGDNKSQVLQEAFRRTGNHVAFVTKVGFEETVQRKTIRRIARGQYDFTYDPPIPKLTATVARPDQGDQKQVEFIIDTGADLTVVPTQVADNLRLWDFIYEQAEVSGVGSSPENRWLYLAKVIVAGKEVFVTIDACSDFSESLLGRDVLNEFRLTLSAPENIVRVEVV